MVDGSHLPLKKNISYTKYISSLAHAKGMTVEAELGRLSGTEDDLTVEDYDAKLTDVNQVNTYFFFYVPTLLIRKKNMGLILLHMNYRLKSSLMRLVLML